MQLNSACDTLADQHRLKDPIAAQYSEVIRVHQRLIYVTQFGSSRPQRHQHPIDHAPNPNCQAPRMRPALANAATLASSLS
jgi:hypothetical protein